MRAMIGGEPLWNEPFSRRTEHRRRVTEHPLGAAIEQHDAMLGVDCDDSFRGDCLGTN